MLTPHPRLPVRTIFAALAAATLLGCNDRGTSADMATTASTPSAAPEVAAFEDRAGIGGVGGEGAARRREARPTRPGSAPEPQMPSAEQTSQQAMIIRNGHARIEVDSLEIAVAQVTQLAQRLGGHVANSSTQTGREGHRSAQLTLRIPAPQFDAALGGLTPIGKVEARNVTSEDVTEEYVDMTARMNNAKRLEDRLITLLANRTGKLEEVLAVERELARVREEIERYEGRMRYLRTRAAISTLTVELHEPYPITGRPGGNIIIDAFKRAWRNFVGVIAAIIASLGAIIPLLVVFGLGVFALLRLRRFAGPRRAPKPDTGADEPPGAPPQNPS